MSSFKALGVVAALSIGLLLSTAAQAHPKLLSSTPVDGATLAAPAKIELNFSEKLTTQFSGAKLIMTECRACPHTPPWVSKRVSRVAPIRK